MNVSRAHAAALLVGALCVLGVLATPALVAGAAGAHTREHRPDLRRAGSCRHHVHRHRRCRTALHAVKHHARRRSDDERRAARRPAVGAGGSLDSSAPAAASPGAGAAPGTSGSSPSGETANAGTETPANEAPGALPATARVQVVAKEYSFTLSRAEVPAGKVIVEFVNGGEDPHNLHLDLEEPAESIEAGAFPTSSPGFHGDLTLNLHPGTYTLFCSLPGHEAKGMKATLTVH